MGKICVGGVDVSVSPLYIVVSAVVGVIANNIIFFTTEVIGGFFTELKRGVYSVCLCENLCYHSYSLCGEEMCKGYFFFFVLDAFASLLKSRQSPSQKLKSFLDFITSWLTNTKPFMVLPLCIMARQPFISTAISNLSGPMRHISSFLFAQIHILPFTIKQVPLNILFSSTFFVVESASRILSVSCSFCIEL